MTSSDTATKQFFVTAVYERKKQSNKVAVTVGEGKKETAKPAKSKSSEKGFIERTTEVVANGLGSFVDFVMEKGRTATSVGTGIFSGGGGDCGQRHCIKKGDKNELIREINIRLAGFGGNVPTDEFTDRTEKMIKQFQRDYMNVPETGRICGDVLRAIDEFTDEWVESIKTYKCLCHASGSGVRSENRCSGYGEGRRNEHPGMHRSLLWGISSLKFYLSKQSKYKYRTTTAGYRCWSHNNSIPRRSTNHMGKAVDIQFNEESYQIVGRSNRNLNCLRKIRDNFYVKYLNAEEGWSIPSVKNTYRMEPIGMGRDESYSWIHLDVTVFEPQYLTDEFFTKVQNDIKGKSITTLANELGFENLCSCFNMNLPSSSPIKDFVSCEEKFNKVAPIILEHEGGFVNHPSDKGGPTNMGITIGTWTKYANEDLGIENPTVSNLSRITNEQATIIYRKRYWEPKKFCEIIDEHVSLMIYDWTITSGGAVKQVQKLLVNDFEQDIIIDGAMGSLTAKAINNVKDQNKLLYRIAEIRKQYYTDLTYTNGQKNNQDVFLEGWHNRVDKCLKYKL